MRRPCIFPAVGRQLLVQGSATSPSSALLLRGDVLRSRSLARPGSVRHLRASSSPSVFPTTASATAEEDVQPQTSGMILDLGLPSLVPEWCRMFRSETVLADVAAGLTVGCIAVPLSLAIAVASGLPPEVGLVSAATAGLVGSLMGGTTLAITGPANAIILLIGEAVHTHGIAALPMITCAAGALQLLTGVARGGRVTKYVPWNVISGFTTGIGLMILTGQLPKALGLAVPGGLKPFEIVAAMGERITDVNFGAAALAMGTAAAMLSLPKLHPKIPSALVAVAGATAATRIFDLDVATVGALPSAVDAFQLSALTLPPVEALPSLGSTILLIYAMISIESLLSCSAIDKMRPTPYKHCADQELIGQGLANMTSSAFMGMPVTAVIARSSLNVKLKGSTRLPGLVQAGFVFSSMAFFSDTVATVPIASLSGVLITSCISMLPPPEIKHCLAVDRRDVLPYMATTAGMLTVGMAEGIGLGCVTAGAMAMLPLDAAKRLSYSLASFDLGPKASLQLMDETGRRVEIDGRTRAWQLSGKVNFLSMGTIDRLAQQVSHSSQDTVLVDLQGVASCEYTGGEELINRLSSAAAGRELHLINCTPEVAAALRECDAKRKAIIHSQPRA